MPALIAVLEEILAAKDQLGLSMDDTAGLTADTERALELARSGAGSSKIETVLRSIRGFLAPVAIAAATGAAQQLAAGFIAAL